MPHERYSIVVTLGPATADDRLVAGLLSAGADAFRLNTSHLSSEAVEQQLARLAGLRRAQDGGAGPSTGVPVILDLQGSKWRLGEFPPFDLEAGASVVLVQAAAAAGAVLPVPHPDFFAAAPHSSSELRLDDARCLLQVEECAGERLLARVIRGGRIRPRKGITFSRSAFRRESLNARDRELYERVGARAGAGGGDLPRYAVSYVRDALEMRSYREELGPGAYLIAKIERETALGDAAGIADSADELWLCRGDLGAELGARRMAQAVHEFSGRVRDIPVPVLLAGQVLEHMTRSPTPTRSEVCFLYEALQKGFRGVVLSDETAIGDFPIDSCRTAALFR